MSCGLLIAAALFANSSLLTDAALSQTSAAPDVVAGSVAAEPLFVDIVARAEAMKQTVDGWIAAGADEALARGEPFMAFRRDAETLADLDMRAHVTLRDRGVDGDLKCILRGISEDMPIRVDAVANAPDAAERASALLELSHLLDDNAAVILAPPTPETAPHLIPDA